MPQKLPADCFKRVKNTSQITMKIVHNFTIVYSFCLKKIKIKKFVKLVANLNDKKECHTHKKFKTSFKS